MHWYWVSVSLSCFILFTALWRVKLSHAHWYYDNFSLREIIPPRTDVEIRFTSFFCFLLLMAPFRFTVSHVDTDAPMFASALEDWWHRALLAGSVSFSHFNYCQTVSYAWTTLITTRTDVFLPTSDCKDLYHDKHNPGSFNFHCPPFCRVVLGYALAMPEIIIILSNNFQFTDHYGTHHVTSVALHHSPSADFCCIWKKRSCYQPLTWKVVFMMQNWNKTIWKDGKDFLEGERLTNCEWENWYRRRWSLERRPKWGG